VRLRHATRCRAESLHHIRPESQGRVVIFAALTEQAEITPQPEEIAEAFWLSVEEAEDRLTYERDRRILREAFEHVQKYHRA